MQLKIYNDCYNTNFPQDGEDRSLPWERKDIETIKIKVASTSLVADLIWDLLDRASLQQDQYDYVSDVFFPNFGLKQCRSNAKVLPYLKTVKELKLLDGNSLVFCEISFGQAEDFIKKEYNTMRENDEKLLDRVFRWTQEKLDMLVSNIVENNDLEKFVDETVNLFIKGTGIIRDEADKKRYLDTFRRVATYQVVEPTMKPSREKFEKEKDYFWLYLVSKIEKRCREGQKEVLKEINSFTKKDVDWLADKGYLGKVKS